MGINIEKISFKSSNNINIVRGKIMTPATEEIKGVVQLSHGMCEYIERYDEFANYLLEQGYVVAGHDHIGHGDSVNAEKDRGFFAKESGYKYLVKDLHYMTKIVKKRYPNLPYFMLGHSMGSFISRCYIVKYGEELDGIILLGTMGPQWAVDAGIQLADRLIQKKGEMYKSKKLDQLCFEFANLNFEPIMTKYDWTCRDKEVVQNHVEDKKMSFIFSVSAFKDLFNLVKYCNDDKFIKNTPKTLPMLIMSGDMDPVGEDGSGVKKVYELYKKIGIKDITFKLYKNCRHELLNELNKDEIYKDILDWIELIRFGEE
ncbi:MAG: lysophospholipase [Clostridia bacterium]|nr:lysophospholipase [Clostridia bacterium]